MRIEDDRSEIIELRREEGETKKRVTRIRSGLSIPCGDRIPKTVSRERNDRSYEPIISYGTIVFHLDSNAYLDETPKKHETPMFLIYQRRDTFEYMDFLRGAWSDERQLPLLFSGMCIGERERVRQYPHDALWDDLIIDHDCKLYKDGYPKAKRKFETIKDKIPHLLDTTMSYVVEPPWGFPKGKKSNPLEDPIDCALRETSEETRIKLFLNGEPDESQSDGVFARIWNIKPFFESFKGSNGKIYNTYYYLVELAEMKVSEKIPTPHCIRKETLSDEARDLRWVTYEEACSLLNPRRQNILKRASHIIRCLRQEILRGGMIDTSEGRSDNPQSWELPLKQGCNAPSENEGMEISSTTEKNPTESLEDILPFDGDSDHAKPHYYNPITKTPTYSEVVVHGYQEQLQSSASTPSNESSM